MIRWFWKKVPSTPCWSIFHRQTRSDIKQTIKQAKLDENTLTVLKQRSYFKVKILILLPNFHIFSIYICENLLVYQENFSQLMFFYSQHNPNILITWILFFLSFSDATTWEYEGQFWWSKWSWTVCLLSKLVFVLCIKLERLSLITFDWPRKQSCVAMSWVFSDKSYQSNN